MSAYRLLTVTAVAALAGAAALAAGSASAPEPLFYEAFSYPAGRPLSAKGTGMPEYEIKIEEDKGETEGRMDAAVVAPKGLTLRGVKSLGRAAMVVSAIDRHGGTGRITASKAIDGPSQADAERLYFSVLLLISNEMDLPHPGARVGARVRLKFTNEKGESRDSDISLGADNFEERGWYFAAFGGSYLRMAKAEAGRTVLMVLRMTDPKGDWNTLVEVAPLDPGEEEPAEWTEVKKGGTPGDYKVTGIELFAERPGWKQGPTRAMGMVDEIRVGKTYGEVVVRR